MALRIGALSWLTALGLAACSGPVALYHDAAGGAIAQARPAPPGANLPYPNLASVPAAPVALTKAQQRAVAGRLAGTAPAGVSPPSPGALEGLELPAGPPPAPQVPGLALPATPTAWTPPPPPPVAAATAPPPSIPVALSFAAGTALLNADTATALSGIAAGRGQASILVAGFGDGGMDEKDLDLALARARRLADGLTADGVPPAAIRLLAAAAGSGGFAQLVY